MHPGRSRSSHLGSRARGGRLHSEACCACCKNVRERGRGVARPGQAPRRSAAIKSANRAVNQFIGKILGDLGGAFSVPMVRMGDILGLYKALNEHGAMTSAELAVKTKVDERYAREWLSHQASSGYVDYDPASGKFTLPPEQAMVFANVDSPVYLQGAFDLAVAMAENQPKVEAAFRSGKGVGWGDQTQCLFCTVGRFFRPGYHNNLVEFLAAGAGRRRRET